MQWFHWSGPLQIKYAWNGPGTETSLTPLAYTVETPETNTHKAITVRTQCKAQCTSYACLYPFNGARSRNALARVMTLNSKCTKDTKSNARRVSKYSCGHKGMMYRHRHRFKLHVNQPQQFVKHWIRLYIGLHFRNAGIHHWIATLAWIGHPWRDFAW